MAVLYIYIMNNFLSASSNFKDSKLKNIYIIDQSTCLSGFLDINHWTIHEQEIIWSGQQAGIIYVLNKIFVSISPQKHRRPVADSDLVHVM